METAARPSRFEGVRRALTATKLAVAVAAGVAFAGTYAVVQAGNPGNAASSQVSPSSPQLSPSQSDDGLFGRSGALSPSGAFGGDDGGFGGSGGGFGGSTHVS